MIRIRYQIEEKIKKIKTRELWKKKKKKRKEQSKFFHSQISPCNFFFTPLPPSSDHSQASFLAERGGLEDPNMKEGRSLFLYKCGDGGFEGTLTET